MKYLTIAILLLTAAIAHSGLVGFLTKESRDWAFIQSVGGMKVSLKENKLIVDCNVSGTKKVTTEPRMINSGIVVRKVVHKQVGKTIHLTVVTSVVEKGLSATCKPIHLSKYPAGTYTVQYLDRDKTTHELGKITIPSKTK